MTVIVVALVLTAFLAGVGFGKLIWQPRSSLDDIIDVSWRKAVREIGLGQHDS